MSILIIPIVLNLQNQVFKLITISQLSELSGGGVVITFIKDSRGFPIDCEWKRAKLPLGYN